MSTELSDDADALRDDIAQTRDDLADTVTALSAKTDVTARAKKAVGDLAADAARKGRETVEQVGDAAAGLPGQLRADATRLRDVVTGEKPQPADLRPFIRLAAIAAIGIGMIVWLARRRRG